MAKRKNAAYPRPRLDRIPAPDASVTLNVRGIDAKAAQAIKSGAASRGLTIGEYLGRLASLHHAARVLAVGDAPVRAVLAKLGLETVET